MKNPFKKATCKKSLQVAPQEKQITNCYKFSDNMNFLKQKLVIGKEYLFSDILQEEKSFKVVWKKGFLTKIERHPNSANCFVCENQYFLYIKEVAPQENYFLPIPSQALKSWRYFDRFNINLYHEFLNRLNTPYENR